MEKKRKIFPFPQHTRGTFPDSPVHFVQIIYEKFVKKFQQKTPSNSFNPFHFGALSIPSKLLGIIKKKGHDILQIFWLINCCITAIFIDKKRERQRVPLQELLRNSWLVNHYAVAKFPIS